MEIKTVLWRMFEKTGDIEAYLMYKTTENKNTDEKEEEPKWQALTRQAL